MTYHCAAHGCTALALHDIDQGGYYQHYCTDHAGELLAWLHPEGLEVADRGAQADVADAA